jgi:hypothetical protein
MQASYFDKTAPIARRRKLAKAARHAFVRWSQAAEVYQQLSTAVRPDFDCIEWAERRCAHLLYRYTSLENALAEEADLPTCEVFRQINSCWPICPLLVANL